MLTIEQTPEFSEWLENLADKDARMADRIAGRVARFVGGNFGDAKSVGDGVMEARFITAGPGYRIYFTRRGRTMVILLCGGDKRSQQRDIALAKHLAAQVEN